MQASSSSSSVISPEDILECLMNDGTIDALRLKIINQLKANRNRPRGNYLMHFDKNLKLLCSRMLRNRWQSDMNMKKGGAANEVARKSVEDRWNKSPHSKTLNLA
ncbi:unnamed protein product [Linum trigynum]|uniref:Uncharacterized protein n=1 Tax=Linum trigynum TaxID=586398 RepID=A0AAV2GD61_9ROSI